MGGAIREALAAGLAAILPVLLQPPALALGIGYGDTVLGGSEFD